MAGNSLKLKILTTGGTIDKIYFDSKSEFEVGEPEIGRILDEAQVAFDYEVVQLLRKDSLELDDKDRELIRQTVAEDECDRILITHGTDTMTDTAAVLDGMAGKTIVLTGALHPARFRSSDAIFNIGMAVVAAESMPAGIYITMNGRVFDAARVRKNRDHNRFEPVPDGET